MCRYQDEFGGLSIWLDMANVFDMLQVKKVNILRDFFFLLCAKIEFR